MTRQYAIILGVLVIITFLAVTWAQDRSSDLEGAKPYIPSRLEWLGVELNANLRVSMSVDNGYLMSFVPIEKENVILIYVRHLPKVNREVMNISINSAREVISIKAKQYGWDSWLEVREDIQMEQLK